MGNLIAGGIASLISAISGLFLLLIMAMFAGGLVWFAWGTLDPSILELFPEPIAKIGYWDTVALWYVIAACFKR